MQEQEPTRESALQPEQTRCLSKELEQKYAELRRYLASLGSVVVAFSAGVDSTLLLWVAHDVLAQHKTLAVTARSCSFPARELNAAVAFCAEQGIEHVIIESEELDIPGFAQNPPDRCYLCKSGLFSRIWPIAHERGLAHVIEGSNADDTGDYRPGLKAVREQGVESPLLHAGLTKDEVRSLASHLGLKVHDKPSFACLASRFPYGEKITATALEMVAAAEQYLLDQGFSQVRVRNHRGLARIETDASGFALLEGAEVRRQVYAYFKRLGFDYVALDVLGYRSGSMNETLDSLEVSAPVVDGSA